MARRFDFYIRNSTSTPVWVSVAFPDTDSEAIPSSIGIYRFTHIYQGEKQIFFVGISARYAMFGETLRASYFSHRTLCNNNDTDLAEMYAIGNLLFEHFSCPKNEAEEHIKEIIVNCKPRYNLKVEFVVTDFPVTNPFV